MKGVIFSPKGKIEDLFLPTPGDKRSMPAAQQSPEAPQCDADLEEEGKIEVRK